MEPWDVTIVGGGILGTSVAYWLAARYDGRFAVVEREPAVGEHASRRNTGVVHRPFYLHPAQAKVFARAAAISYHLWKKYAAEKGLPWSEVGTYEVALDDSTTSVLDTYVQWAERNGMQPSEVERLDGRSMREREPNIRCAGALFSKTDTAVDFRAFTDALREDAERAGARFLLGSTVVGVNETTEGLAVRLAPTPREPPVYLDPRGRVRVSRPAQETLHTRFLIGCAGGNAVDFAHMMGVGLEYTDLHFRGEYWVVSDAKKDLVRHNVYSVPRHRDLPFLDPHWIVRANGRREIGPNAVPVPGPEWYTGLLWPMTPWLRKLLEPPVRNKMHLALSKDFFVLSAQEMWSSISKGEMVRRVQKFLPALQAEDLRARGTAGIRSTVVNRHGAMMKEAIEVPGPHSYHILNYNSPGATGAPAFAAYLVDRLAARGDLDHLQKNPKHQKVWDWDAIAGPMEFAG